MVRLGEQVLAAAAAAVHSYEIVRSVVYEVNVTRIHFLTSSGGGGGGGGLDLKLQNSHMAKKGK